MIDLEILKEGSAVHAAVEFRNGGSTPKVPAEALLAPGGRHGVTVRTGDLEDNPASRRVSSSGAWPEGLRAGAEGP
jgi:hypothetical protein